MRPKIDPAELDFAPDGVWASIERSSVAAAVIVGPSGTILAANEGFAGLVGVAAEALQQRPVHELLSGEQDRARWHAARRAGVADALQLSLLGPNGTERTVRGDLRPTTLGTARRALLAVFVDISEELQLRNAVQRSARLEALGSLTSGVAHDFNNLLTVLVGNLSLAAEEMRGRPTVFAKLKAARDAARRGSDLIRQLLTFARRESVEADVIDPARVIGNLTELLKRALGSKIELTTNLEPGAGPILGNVAMLESAIVNLTVNARDAVGSDGRVSLAARNVHRPDRTVTGRCLAAGEFVEIIVQDNGSGMSAALLERAFEPFFSTKRDSGGTGLGLSMVRAFAEQAGGCVSIDSTEGRGTTVQIDLPRCVDGVEETAARTMPLSTLPTGTECVVVLSREDSLRATVSQILEVLGYDVTLVADVPGTCEALRTGKPQLLIVDGALAEELLGADSELIGAAPIIVLTAGGETPLGMGSVVLRKPFSLADLAGAVRGTLDVGAPLPGLRTR